MIRSLAFVVENIISVWYTITLGWAFKFDKVRNLHCQYSATWIKKNGDVFMLYGMIYTYEWFFCYNWHELYPSNKLLFFHAYIVFWWNTLFKYQTRNELIHHPLWRWCVERGAAASSYEVMPSSTAIWIFSIFRSRDMAELILFRISAVMFSMMLHRCG